jgi:4-hydroxybenzoate polyprenyltransferase/phosphoserine phosphatase
MSIVLETVSTDHHADDDHAGASAVTVGLPPLAVDLDGTLILTDTLHESVVACAKLKPGVLIEALPRGRAAFKRAVAELVDFDPALLPFNTDMLAFLQAEKQAGRRIGLFTAADQSIADAVARHLGLFDVVRGSDGVTNLSGEAKAAAIEAAFGPRFVYAGDGSVDQPIFARASGVILVGPVERLKGGLPGDAVIEATFPVPRAGLLVWLRALRLRHWVKNALVFVAPLLALESAISLIRAAILFVLLGVLASATYLINDLLDLGADRAHAIKRFRPLASGALAARDATAVAAAMIVGSLLLSLTLPFGCTLILLAYLAITLSYSLALKRLPMVDVIVLAGLFTLRVFAGNMIVSGPISSWLLTFSMLFFLGLAMIKRYAELDRVSRLADGKGKARGYTQQDLPILLAAGLASGISAVVIFVVYLINEQYPRAIYGYPSALWGIMPVLLAWTLRLWHLSVHGRMNEDPVVFALKDRFSLASGVVVLLILSIARL